MIKFNSNTINDWYFGDDNIIKVYKHNAVVFYKFDSEQGGYQVCFAVVDDITQYTDTEFEDVYDKATEKWYKLNNLNQYEEYGVYASGRSVTTYKGKLTIDDGYEYEWNGSSWVNLGEVSGSSRVPIGYTEVEYIENTSTAYINLGIDPYNATGNSFTVESTFSSFTQSSFAYLISSECTTPPYYGFILRWNNNNLEFNGASIGIDTTATNIPNGDGTSAITFHSESTTTNNCNTPITLFCGMNGSSPWRNGKGKCYSFKLTINNNIVRDLVPAKRDSDEKYGMYDIVNDVFYLSPNNVDFIGGSETGSTEYPKYYSEKSEPLDNLSFNTMAEAQAYAEANCVYVGLRATIDGDKYVFSGDSISGYEWVYNPSRLPFGYTEVEYVENTGTSYLDIAFKPNSNTRILTEMQAVSSAEYPRLFGSGAWNAAGGINLAYQTSGGYNCLHINWYGRTSWSYYTSFTFDYNKHTYDLNKNYLYRDETLVGSTSYTTSYQSTDNLGVFTYINGGIPSSSYYWGQEHFKGKMFSFKVYDNGTLVRDLVPCIKDSDDTVGAYDIVNDVFYTVPTGYTTDKLIAGNPV